MRMAQVSDEFTDTDLRFEIAMNYPVMAHED
jgi:hypothetical protein